MISRRCFASLFFFNDTATTEIYTLSLHDALPISLRRSCARCHRRSARAVPRPRPRRSSRSRSEEHTSELQSQSNLVCRLLLEKKKKSTTTSRHSHNNTYAISAPLIIRHILTT